VHEPVEVENTPEIGIELETEREDDGEERLIEPEPKIDLELDRLAPERFGKPDESWEQMIRGIKVREPQTPSAEEQRARIRWLLDILDNEKDEPSKEQAAEVLKWLENIQTMIPNHEGSSRPISRITTPHGRSC
jgi:hypothetical protein